MRANKRLITLGITLERYLELKNFCRQYDQKKTELRNISFSSSINYNNLRDKNKLKNSEVEKIVIRKEQLEKDINLIENIAKKTNENLWQFIIENVTRGTIYEYLTVPCGRRYFYKMIENFFINLHKEKGSYYE